MRLWPILLLALSSCSPESQDSAPPALPPNIVLLIADDLGNADLGYRAGKIETPNLDALAAESVRLERFYAQPLCTPTRATLHTGQDPGRWVYGIPADNRPTRATISDKFLTLPERFVEAGYATALFGKWHLGTSENGTPWRHGYQYSYGMIGGIIDYWTHRWADRLDWHRNGVPLEEEGYSTILIGRDTARWIRERDRTKPFFLNVSFNAPHFPMDAVTATMKKYQDAGACLEPSFRCNYMAMTQTLDEAIGEIVATLDAEQLRENTLIIFFSDNGGLDYLGADNSPFRGVKSQLYEGGVRVPAFFNWPGVLRPSENWQRGRVSDLYATLEEAAGLTRKAPKQGRSLWHSITTGEAFEREPFFWQNETGSASDQPSRCLRCPESSLRKNRSMLTDHWKLITAVGFNEKGRSDPKSLTAELFEIVSDPSEAHDVSGQHPEKVEAMLRILQCWSRRSCDVEKIW